MKRLLYLIVPVMIAGGCHSSFDTNSDTQIDTSAVKDNWTTLFDGKSTKGWHTYGQSEAGSAWKAENGELHLDAGEKAGWQTKNGGDLVTDDTYEDFELSIEWKISKAGNSGIIFNVEEDPKKFEYSWSTGIETQVADNEENEDGKLVKHRAGDLYDLMSISKDAAKPAGEWNKTVIVLHKGVLNILINDEHVLNTMLWNDNWKTLIARSKFRTYPYFGMFKKGKIALQDHGADVWFRDIKIKKL